MVILKVVVCDAVGFCCNIEYKELYCRIILSLCVNGTYKILKCTGAAILMNRYNQGYFCKVGQCRPIHAVMQTQAVEKKKLDHQLPNRAKIIK